MYLIRKGEKPCPICCSCHGIGPEGHEVPRGYVFACDKCMEIAESDARRAQAQIARFRSEAAV